MDLGSLFSFLPDQPKAQILHRDFNRRHIREGVIKITRSRPPRQVTFKNPDVTAFSPSPVQPKKKAATKRPDKKSLNLVENRVRAELLMKNTHYLLRTLKRKAEQQTELLQEVDHFKNQASLFFNPNHFKDRPKTEMSNRKPGHRCIAIHDAHRKVVSDIQASWLRQRHRSEPEVSDVPARLFAMLDTRDKGRIASESLVKLMLSFGVSQDCESLKEVLCRQLGVETLDGLSIQKRAFLDIFDAEKDKVLKKINKFCIKVSGDRPAGALEYQHIVNSWWDQAEGKTPAIIERLVKLGIFSNSSDCRAYLEASINKNGQISRGEFQRVFATSVFRGGCQRVFEKLNGRTCCFPLQVGAYQRALLMSATKCAEAGIPEAASAVASLEKYYENQPGAKAAHASIMDRMSRYEVPKAKEKIQAQLEKESEVAVEIVNTYPIETPESCMSDKSKKTVEAPLRNEAPMDLSSHFEGVSFFSTKIEPRRSRRDFQRILVRSFDSGRRSYNDKTKKQTD